MHIINGIIPALPATVTDPYILQHFERFLYLYITKQMSEADEDKNIYCYIPLLDASTTSWHSSALLQEHANIPPAL